jgi:hypothetical protein
LKGPLTEVVDAEEEEEVAALLLPAEGLQDVGVVAGPVARDVDGVTACEQRFPRTTNKIRCKLQITRSGDWHIVEHKLDSACP